MMEGSRPSPARRRTPVPTRTGAALLGLLSGLLLALAAGCDLLAPRDPEVPDVAGGTYEQPDTPEQVIENVQAAVAELNARNYRRSFADAFTFTPTAAAAARDPAVWTGWGRDEEERTFNTMATAAQSTTGNELRLNDRTLTVIREDRFVLDATYVLTIHHRRRDLDDTVQGRLVWTIDQGRDGLWQISEWTDQTLGDAASWSDLKAAFAK